MDELNPYRYRIHFPDTMYRFIDINRLPLSKLHRTGIEITVSK